MVVLLLLSYNSYSQTQEAQPKVTRILFVLDASASMQNTWGERKKITSAKHILMEIIDSLKELEDVYFALRVYGHQSPASMKDCKDTKREVGFGSGGITAATIRDKLNNLKPKGTTPIAYSLQMAAGDFPTNVNSRNIIILITDGIEACDEDPCAASLALQRKSIFLKPFIIGLGVGDKGNKEFDCIGSFFNAENEAAFRSIFRNIISKILNQTTAQVLLLDEEGNPTETDINMTFYDNFSGLFRYDFYHTFDDRGLSDTLYLDPVNQYDILVHTLPPVEKKGVDLIPTTHNIINIDVPQGYLKLTVQGITAFKNIHNKIKCLVRLSGDYKTLNVQDFGVTEKYITGKYDIEILSLPRIIKRDVEISQSSTTTIQIEVPGLLHLSKTGIGYGAIFVVEGNKMKKIYELNSKTGNEIIALQPGHYRAVFRPKNSKRMKYSVDKTFTIKSGDSVTIKL